MRTLYNRKLLESRLRKHFKGHRISKNLDLLIYLNYVLYIKRLAEVSSNFARQQPSDRSDRSKRSAIPITDQIVRSNTEQVLREFRG